MRSHMFRQEHTINWFTILTSNDSGGKPYEEEEKDYYEKKKTKPTMNKQHLWIEVNIWLKNSIVVHRFNA